MAHRLVCALFCLVLGASLAAAQEKKTPAKGEKAGPDKAGTEKAGTEKAGDAKQPPKVNEKTAAFNKLRSELTATIKRLGEIQYEYRLAKKDARAALEKEFEDKKTHAKKLAPQVTAAAEAAIAVDPTDPDVMDHLGALARQAEKYSHYEEALRFAQLVLDHQPAGSTLRRPELFRIGGMSAFNAAKLDAAEKYLTELEKKEYTREDFPSAAKCRARLKEEREHWEEEVKRQTAEKKPPTDPQALPRVLLKTTQGDIVVELFENEAPNTVANFITLVEKKFYDGKALETPGKDEVRTGLPNLDDKDMDYTIACECNRPDFRRHFRGSLAMSIPQGKDTGRSQFVIWLEPARDADPKVIVKNTPTEGVTVFGRVVSGLDVLSKVRQTVLTRDLSHGYDTLVQGTVLNKRPHAYAVKRIEQAKAKADTSAKPPVETKTPAEGKTEPTKTTPEKTETGKTDAPKKG